MADTKHPTAAIPVEGDGVSYRGIVWFVVILTITTLVCQGLMFVLLKTFQHQTAVATVSPMAAPAAVRPGLEGRVYPTVNALGGDGPQPRLLVNEPGNLEAFRAREHETLTTYGWVDRNTGVVRIPVERAKDLLLERGLPVRGSEPAKDVKTGKDVKEVKK